MDLALNINPTGEEPLKLKEEYNKAIEEQKAVEAEAKAKAAQEAKAAASNKAKNDSPKSIGSNLVVPPIKPGMSAGAGDAKPVSHVQGVEAIKNEFKKLGFVFQSDTTAIYRKNGIEIGLLYRGDKWQLATKVYGDDVEDIFYCAIKIIWGDNIAWNNLIYIDYALDMPNTVHTSPNIEAFVNNDKLVVYIFVPKE